jgi:hypothetical protein
MAKSKVVPDYKLEHTNKELDGRLTSLLLLAQFFSSAFMLVASWPRTPSKLSGTAPGAPFNNGGTLT